MSTDTNRKFRDAFKRLFAPDCDATASTLVTAMLNQVVVYSAHQVLDASINTAGTYTLDQSTGLSITALTFKVITHANVTAVNTNTAVFSLVYNNGNGGTDTTIASINTATTAGGGSGDITALVPLSIAVNSSTQVIPAGSQVQVKITKEGTGGNTLPALTVEFKGHTV